MAEAPPSPSLAQLFQARVRQAGHRVALREKRSGRWHETTWLRWFERSQAIAAQLKKAGVRPGDRVGILANTRQYWLEADMAIFMAGAISVPIYPTLPADQVAYIVKDAGVEVLFCDNPLQVEKALAHPDCQALLKHCISFDMRAMRPTPDFRGQSSLDLWDVDATARCQLHHLEQWLKEAAEGDATENAQSQKPVELAPAATLGGDRLATLMYTSGTSGNPKGVMLSHGNFVSEIEALAQVMNLGPHDEQLLFLPLSHVFGRLLALAQLQVGYVTTFAESLDKVMDNAQEVNPSFFAAVPRLFQKIVEGAEKQARMGGRLGTKSMEWALDIGKQMRSAKVRGGDVAMGLRLRYRYADRFMLSKVRALFGSRFRFALSGGAALPPSIAEAFDACGIQILEGYGLTETSAATHVNTPEARRIGTVGRAIPGLEVRLADDHEVLVRGPSVMQGYWQSEEATKAAIDDEGFFHTGDIGIIDSQGFLRITDRKKDIIVTANGKNVAPQNVEGALKASSWIREALVYGDGRSYLVALLVLDEDKLKTWAHSEGRLDELEWLYRDTQLRQVVQEEIEAINEGLARFENVRRFAILQAAFDEASGDLTPSFKIKRRLAYRKYRGVIETLYAGGVI